MALVRRTKILGHDSSRVVAAATVGSPAGSSAGSPAESPGAGGLSAEGSAAASAPSAAQGGGDEVGVAVATAGPPEPTPGGEAAAVPPQPASVLSLVSAFVLVALGGVGAWAFDHWDINAEAIRLPDATTIFAALFAFATAVERVLEPFSRFLPGRHTRGELEKAVANLANKYHEASLDDLIRVAHAKSMLEKGRASRGLVTWGIATAVATVASASGGLYLLHAMAADGWDGIPLWADAIVTGIVVGSGTKPLHDVISKVQKNKEKSEDAP
jgi:hypothetical protein